MVRYIFVVLIFIHGLIHIMGFLKSFHIMEIDQLTGQISRPQGVLWLLVFLLFFTSIFLLLFREDYWPMVALIAVILSQGLIITSWSDAKFGTIANVIILIAATFSYASTNFTRQYHKDVTTGLLRTTKAKQEVFEERDLQHLPDLVQKYLRSAGVVGKYKVYNAKIKIKGQMRGKNQNWFQFTSEQYNFFDQPSRFFFMQARVKGLSTYGYHQYKNTKAQMVIKVLGLIPVVNHSGPALDTAETVTLFNDMCLMAPATLIDKNIIWKEIDSQSVMAMFTNNHITISATLYFNEKGQLIDFQSDDRYDINEKGRYRFSTPTGKYLLRDGYELCSYGEAVWHYPDGNFTYGEFDIESIEYNVKEYTDKIPLQE